MEEYDAVFSACRMYRYTLRRTWDPVKPAVLFVCLNPSTADESRDDPTVRRCRSFARSWGYGGLILCNLFAYRAKTPGDMLAASDPVGPENDAWLVRMAESTGIVIAAWGARGKHMGRNQAVLTLRDSWYCLAVGKNGQPSHPLYLKGDCVPIPYIHSVTEGHAV